MKTRNTSFYFPHDYNAHNDERLLMLRAEFGAEGYGVFWMILESMAMASNGQINRVAIGGLSLGYGVPKDRLLAIIDYCIAIELFKESQEQAIYSDRMLSHIAIRQSLSDAGRAGAAKRWSTSQKNSHPISPPNANERKGKEKKGKEIDDSTVVAPSAPTPAQEARKFFEDEQAREEIIAKLIASGTTEEFARAEVRKFCYYWTERNKSGTKQRWETEKAFEVRRRLSTWLQRASTPFPRSQ